MAKNNKQTAGQDSVSKMVTLGSKKFIAQHLNYARTSPVIHAHITCYTCAQQLLCNRTTAVGRLQKVSLPATYPIFSNNLSYISQGLM